MIRAILGRIYLSRGFGGVIKELLVALGGGKGEAIFIGGAFIIALPRLLAFDELENEASVTCFPERGRKPIW